jgi:hypothetical protein
MDAGGYSPDERRYGYRSIVPMMELWVTGEGTEAEGNGQFTFGAEFENNGSEPLHNVKLVSRIYHAETGICNYEKTTGKIDTLAVGESSELHMNVSPSYLYDYNGFNGGESGRFVFENYLIADEFPDGIDNGKANSWDTTSFLITKGEGSDYGRGIFGRDGGYRDKTFQNISTVPGFGSQAGVEVGLRWLPARAHKAKAIQVYVDDATEVGAQIRGKVYTVNLNAASDYEYWQETGIVSETYTIEEEDKGTWVKLDLHDEFDTYKSMEANVEHFTSVEIMNDKKFYPGENASKYRYYQMQSVSAAHGRGMQDNGEKGSWARFDNKVMPMLRLEVCQDCVYDFCEENPLDAECTDTTLNVGNEKSLEHIYVGQNYPNPFNLNTIVAYELGFNAEQVTVQVLDVTGNQVKLIDLGSVPAGSYTLNIAANDLAPGLYYYSFNIDGIRLTRRMVVSN